MKMNKTYFSGTILIVSNFLDSCAVFSLLLETQIIFKAWSIFDFKENKDKRCP